MGGPPDPAVESVWMARIARGDVEAMEHFYHAYYRRLFVYFLRLLRDRAVAEELVDDVMWTVWRRARSFRGAARPSTWVFGIAHRKARKALRRRRPAAAVADGVAGPGPDILEQAELGERVRRALEGLSPAHREVLELVFYHGFSYEEVAAIVGCPVGTVKTRVFHAKRRLQALLTAGGEGRP